MMNNSQQSQLIRKIIFPCISKDSKEGNRKAEDTQPEDKMKQQLKNLEKHFVKVSNETAKGEKQPIILGYSKLQQKQNNYNNYRMNQYNIDFKKKEDYCDIEKQDQAKKDILTLNQQIDANNYQQIGLSIQQKKMTQQLKRLEKYTNNPILINNQNNTRNISNVNGNLNFNSISITSSSANQYNNINSNNYSNTQNYNNFDSYTSKRDMRRMSNQNNNYNNFISTYLSCFNGENFMQIVKKYDKDLLPVYDCFMNMNPQIPFHLTQENKRKLRYLIDRHKNIGKKINNQAFRFEKNAILKDKQFKMFENFQNLSDKDKFNLIRMGNFPAFKLFPNVSTLKYDLCENQILFDSKFESGNLRRVYKTDHFTQWYFFSTLNIKKSNFEFKYMKQIDDLQNLKILENILKNLIFKRHKMNLYKERSLYEKGLRPVVFSQKAFEESGEKWHRDCENIQYTKNEFKRVNFSNMISSNNIFIQQQLNNQQGQQQQNNIFSQNNGTPYNNGNGSAPSISQSQSNNSNINANSNSNIGFSKKRNNFRNNNLPPVYYSTLSFTYTYKYDDDTVYFAHSVPYTYTSLNHYVNKLNTYQPAQQFYKVDTLSTTLVGNKVFCISISNNIHEALQNSNEKKEVVICSRVHPGETNASWIMKGMLDFLLSDNEIAINLRNKYIFRMIPMLNPDGVRYGNYRCCLFGNDLNRKWKKALDVIHTPIHAIKKLIKKLQFSETNGQNEQLKNSQKVELFCDIHGHSKSMGAFIYGCQLKQDEDSQEFVYKSNMYKESNNGIKVFPYLYSQRKDYFSFEKCNFNMQKDKQGTARVVGFQELQVQKSYTLECSFLGFKNPQIKYLQNNKMLNNIIKTKINNNKIKVGSNLQEDGQSNLLEMSVQDFEEVGREFLITLNLMTDKVIVKQTMDIFTFKDQQIRDTNVLIEDLQNRIRLNEPLEMNIPQFLITNNNFKQNERQNIQLNIERNSPKQNQYVVNDENQTGSQVNLPKIIHLQTKKSFTGTSDSYQNQQFNNKQNYLTDRTQNSQKQIKQQKPHEYTQKTSMDNIDIQIGERNKIENLEIIGKGHNQEKKNSLIGNNDTLEQETSQPNQVDSNFQSYNFISQQKDEQNNISSQERFSPQDNSQTILLDMQINGKGLASPQQSIQKNINSKDRSFEVRALEYLNSDRSAKVNNQFKYGEDKNQQLSYSLNRIKTLNNQVDLPIHITQIYKQLDYSQNEFKDNQVGIEQIQSNNQQKLNSSILSPQKRVVNSIHFSNTNMPQINNNVNYYNQVMPSGSLAIQEETKTAGRDNITQLPQIDQSLTINETEVTQKKINDIQESIHLPRFEDQKKGQKKPLGISQSSNAINRKVLDTSIIVVQQPNLLNQKNQNYGGQNKNNQMYSPSIQTPPIELNSINNPQNKSFQGVQYSNKQLKSNISSVENQVIQYDSPNIINNQYINCQSLIKVASLSCNNPLNRLQHHQQHYFKKNKPNNILSIGNSSITNPPSIKQTNCNPLPLQSQKSEQELFEQTEYRFNQRKCLTRSQILIKYRQIQVKRVKVISNRLLSLNLWYYKHHTFKQ